MRTEMVMPQMGESITEATVLKWLKNVGEEVKKDETILEISTDKVDSEIPAPASGYLVEIIAQPGQTVPVKSVIAIISTEKGEAAPGDTPVKELASSPAAPVEASSAPTPVAAPAAKKAPASPVQLKSPLGDDLTQYGVGVAKIGERKVNDDRFYSPLVKNLASQHGLTTADLAEIKGTGTQGRVTKQDVLDYVSGAVKPSAALTTSQASATPPTPPAAQPSYDASGVVIEPFDNMRKRIAEHMVRSKATSPHVYTVNEVDMTNIARWREKMQKTFQQRTGFKLSFMPFFIEAVAKGLAEYPRVNASVDGENLVLKRDVNVGCAVALGTTGLIVPVIKRADQLSLVGIATSLNDLALKARDKKLKPDDTQGGTFTVTNVGGFGSIIGYPIINQPQLAIMAIGAIKKRPVVVNDAIAIRDMCYLTLSYDHRVLDGSMGGGFLNYVARYLENWDMERDL